MAPTWIETDTNTNVNISSATAVGVYTSTGDKFVMPQLLVDQVAGSGDYVYYVTLQVNGAGSAYVIGPKTTHTAAAGETAIGAQGGFIAVRAGDVVTVYIDGLAGDTATPDVTVRWFELDASANVTLWKGDAVADLVNGAVPSNLLWWLDGDVSEQLPQVIPIIDDGEGTQQLTQQVLRDAMLLAPSAGAAAVGSVDAQLAAVALEATAQAILEDTGTTLPGLIAVGVGPGSGTGYYTDTIDDGTNPLDGVRVQLYTAQNRVGPAYEAYTNALGVFEMWPDPGTYYRWLDLAGFSFTQDVAVVVTEP